MATVLEMDKAFVQRKWYLLSNHVNRDNIPLWQLITDSGHAEHAAAVAEAKKLLNDPQPKLFEPETEERAEPPMIKALTLAMWYIKKIGCVETAEVAFNAALGAIKKVSK